MTSMIDDSSRTLGRFGQRDDFCMLRLHVAHSAPRHDTILARLTELARLSPHFDMVMSYRFLLFLYIFDSKKGAAIRF